MATKEKPEIQESTSPITFVLPQAPKKKEEPTVPVYLPALEQGDTDMAVDQFEHVSIANEEGQNITHILRGKQVRVTIPVFQALKEKYPDI